MTAANVSNWTFKLGSAASPQVLTAIEEVTDMSNIGATNPLLDATNFDSNGAMEFIAGLAEGDEFTIECNWLPNAAGQIIAYAAQEAKATRLFSATYDGVSPEKVWSGSVICLGYSLAPSPTEVNKVTFTYKITGTLTRA